MAFVLAKPFGERRQVPEFAEMDPEPEQAGLMQRHGGTAGTEEL